MNVTNSSFLRASKFFTFTLISCSSPKDSKDSSLWNSDSGDNHVIYTSSDSDWIDINAGFSHSCGLKKDGSILCWGCLNPSPGDTGPRNSYYDWGQCTAPTGSFVSISDSWRSANCAVTSTGEISCWGEEEIVDYQPKVSNVKQVSTGDAYACLLDTSDSISCWGTYGYHSPEDDISLRGPVSVTVGDSYGCSILDTGDVECWWVINYNLGKSIFKDNSFSQLSLGHYQACGITTDNSALCWGRGEPGEMETLPGSFTQIGVGDDGLVCAINTDGGVQCWGDDALIQATPTSGNFVQLDVGWYHACALRDDGHIVCWGSNASGEVAVP